MECDFPFSYTFSTYEKKQLYHALQISYNPYTDYVLFLKNIKERIRQRKIPDFFTHICKEIKHLDNKKIPAIVLSNCPIDLSLPVFDIEQPVLSKYKLKKTLLLKLF